MKRTFFRILSAVTLLSAVAARGAMSFSGWTGSSIQFNGSQDSFQFTDVQGDIMIGDTDPNGHAWQFLTSGDGNQGSFGEAPFHYGAITTSGNIQYATVTTPGHLAICDSAGLYLLGTIDWLQVRTEQYVGHVNGAGLLNITGLTYSGTDPELRGLINASGDGSLTINFQFNPGQTLNRALNGCWPAYVIRRRDFPRFRSLRRWLLALVRLL